MNRFTISILFSLAVAGCTGNASPDTEVVEDGVIISDEDVDPIDDMMGSASGDAFVQSCMARDLGAVRSALESGVDPDVLYDGSTTCMIQASAGGSIEIVRALLEADADPDIKRASDGYTALMNAAGSGNAEVVRVLLEGGADPTVKNNFGQDASAVARLRDHDALASEIANARVPEAPRASAGRTDNRHVTAEMLGDDWPLATVQKGELDCVGYNQVVIRTSIGVIALNGQAMEDDSFINLQENRDLWRDNPELAALDLPPGSMKIPAAELIQRGLQLCNS